MESRALLRRRCVRRRVRVRARSCTSEAGYTAAAEQAQAGLVAPLKDDTGDDIVSWVDGQVVTDWAAEITKREHAIDGYLNDADPAAPRSTGSAAARIPGWPGAGSATTRSDSTAYRSCCSRRSRSGSESSGPDTARHRANLEARGECASGIGNVRLDARSIGVGPDPSDYVDGVARPVSERQSPLPFGFAFENPRRFEPLSATERTADDARLLARRVFKNSSLLIAKARTADKEENWERDRKDLAARARWIGCSSRARPVTSGA